METNSTLILLSSYKKKICPLLWNDDVALKCAKRPCQVEEIHTQNNKQY